MTQADSVTLKLPLLSWPVLTVPRLVAVYGLLIVIGAETMLIKAALINPPPGTVVCEAFPTNTDGCDAEDGFDPVNLARAAAPAPIFSFSKNVHVVSVTTDISAEDYLEQSGDGFLCGATKDVATIEGRLVAQICPDKSNNKSCIAFFEIADAQLKRFLAQQPGDGADPVVIKTDAAACHPDETEKEGDKP